jgi:predicted amidohydrolase YtcJ
MCQACVSPALVVSVWNKLLPSRGQFLAGAAAFGAALGAVKPFRASAADEVTVIFKNGTIVALDGANTQAQALALAGDRIVFVGDTSDAMARQSHWTKIVDLDGQVVLPGFIDPHQHPISAAIAGAFFVECGPDRYKNKQELIAGLSAEAVKQPPDGWLYAGGFDNLLQGGDLTETDLNRVSESLPVFVLWNNSHTASVNGAALQRANVTSSTPNKPGGGAFGRSSSGALNGIAYETNMAYFLSGIKPTPQGLSDALYAHLLRCASVGLTTIHEAGSGIPGRTDDVLGGYQQIANSDNAPVRLSSSPIVDYLSEGNAFATKFGRPGPRAIQVPGSLLSFYAVKIVGDGSNQTKTAGQTMPYLNTDTKGTINYTHAQFVEQMQRAKSLGWPISVHCNGDATLDVVLDAISEVYGAHSPLGVNRIEHCTITRPDQIERMAKLGVQPSFLINHVYYYGAAYRDELLGQTRAARMDPAGQTVALKMAFTFHSDAPVTRPGPLQMIGCGVTRRCATDGTVVGPDQAVSVEQALRAMTTYAAGQIGLAHELGSIEVGKAADLTILAEDPRKVPPERIERIKVTETWVAGRQVVPLAVNAS